MEEKLPAGGGKLDSFKDSVTEHLAPFAKAAHLDLWHR